MLTVARLKERLHYDLETGIFTWLATTKYRKCNEGKEAGWSDSQGHRNIEIDGRRYKASRLAWLYVTGAWPSEEIDHRDRDPSNNRWGNLREATRALNNVNRVRKRRHDLPRGVDHHRAKFQARLRVNGAVRYLGHFDTAEEAGAAYQRAAQQAYGEWLPV